MEGGSVFKLWPSLFSAAHSHSRTSFRPPGCRAALFLFKMCAVAPRTFVFKACNSFNGSSG
eukprot:3829917-Pyramimonas_sp.AAC.1